MTQSPERILHYAIGPWLSGVMQAALKHEVPAHLHSGAYDAETLAAAAQISVRGAQALLDGLLGLGLVRHDGARYGNTLVAERHLLASSEEDWRACVRLGATDMARYGLLAEVMHGDEPAHEQEEGLAGMAPLARQAALAAAQRVGLSQAGQLRVLDAGGEPAFCQTWVACCPQLVLERNRLGRTSPDALCDMAAMALLSHRLDAADHRRHLQQVRARLRPGGVLVLADVMLTDDRSGPAWALAYHARLMLMSARGAVYRRCEHLDWLRAAGFDELRDESVPDLPVHLIYARNPI